MYAQANRIIAKFGNARNLAKLLKMEPSAVYKWTYPVERGGTGGLVPAASLRKVMRQADLAGIELTQYDLDPAAEI